MLDIRSFPRNEEFQSHNCVVITQSVTITLQV